MFIAPLIAMISGCSNQLTVEPGAYGSSDFCNELSTSLPVTISDQLIRSTSSDSSGVAAWGDPAIILRCGVDKPASIQPTSQLITVNGIDWYPEELTQGQRFTSMNTQQFVEVNIPLEYQPASGILVDLEIAFPTN